MHAEAGRKCDPTRVRDALLLHSLFLGSYLHPHACLRHPCLQTGACGVPGQTLVQRVHDMPGARSEVAKDLRCNLCVYDYSGYGTSAGSPSVPNTVADIDAVFL